MLTGLKNRYSRDFQNQQNRSGLPRFSSGLPSRPV
jgi:hypothetical protein